MGLNSAMAVRCQHLTGSYPADIAKRAGGLLWQPNAGPPR